MEAFSAGGHCAPTRPDYTPSKIAVLLPNLNHLPIRGAYYHPDDEMPGSHLIGPNEWTENRMIERADLQRALAAICWQQRYALFYQYIPEGMTREQHATVAAWDEKTIAKRCDDGLFEMAKVLGYVPPAREQVQRPDGRVWRHPSLDAEAVAGE